MARPLPRAFFARDADVVARDLLGRDLVHDAEGRRRVCRIAETEAYFGPPAANAHLVDRADLPATLRRSLLRHGDPASHAYAGPTPRSAVMFGPPARWYVYLIYGVHECANVVTGPSPAHEPQAVLLRAAAPGEGVDAEAPALGGPGRLTRTMGIGRAFDGADATAPPLRFEEGEPARRVHTTPRIGVTRGAHLRLRFVDADAATRTRSLRRRGVASSRAAP